MFKISNNYYKKFINKYIEQEVTLPNPSICELKSISENLEQYNEKVCNEINEINSRLGKYNLPTNFVKLTNYSIRDIYTISQKLKNLNDKIKNDYQDESIIIETIIFCHFFEREFYEIRKNKSTLEGIITYFDSVDSNMHIADLIKWMKNKDPILNSLGCEKRTRYIALFLIFNPAVYEYDFNISPSYGKRIFLFNKCILELC